MSEIQNEALKKSTVYYYLTNITNGDFAAVTYGNAYCGIGKTRSEAINALSLAIHQEFPNVDVVEPRALSRGEND